MTERPLTLLQVDDLHGDLEPDPEVLRGLGRFGYCNRGGRASIATVWKRVHGVRPCEVRVPDNGDTGISVNSKDVVASSPPSSLVSAEGPAEAA